MHLEFSFYLTLAVIITGLVVLIDLLFFRKNRKEKKWPQPLIVDHARTLFPILIIVWTVRSFIIQPYYVPTGSLEPTIRPGDFIIVSQFHYGMRWPVINKKIISIGEPKRGDIAVFRWPVDTKLIFVKRVIGVPGDHIIYRHKILYINGKKATQKFLYKCFDLGNTGIRRAVDVKEEILDKVKHDILVQPKDGEIQYFNLIVPAHQYFMMGDNRDDSADSRQWGFVPEKNLIGRALNIWMSWDPVYHKICWSRIGRRIH